MRWCNKGWILLFFSISVLFLASQGWAVPYSDRFSSSHALVIGIDKYSNWPHLEYAVADARQMAWTLEKSGFTVTLITDSEATRGTVLAKLEEILRRSDENSRLFIYFAGHGQTEDHPGGGEEGYVVPVDADLYRWKETMLPFSLIRTKMKQARAKHIMLAFDSCYSGLGITRGIGRKQKNDTGYIDKMIRLRSVQVLTAGGRSEQAIEQDGHGLFTSYLLGAIEGQADLDGDGYATGTEIYAALRPLVTSKSFNRQTPQFGYIEGEGDFIFQLNSQKEQKKAVLLVDNKVPGTDIWVNGRQIGTNVSAGHHTFSVSAGRITVLAKNGPHTIYNRASIARPGAELKVVVADGVEATGRQPFSMFTLAHRDIPDFSQSIAYDFDQNGSEEIVTASDSTLYQFNRDGSVRWQKKFAFKLRLDLIEHYNGKPVIGVSGRDDDVVTLLLVSGDGDVVWKHGRTVTARYQNKVDGNGRIAALADLDGDGREEILATASTGYSWKPRGVLVYEQSGRERWRYLCGPSVQNLLVWEHGSTPPDIIIGSYSPGNGNRESHNNTDDTHAYVISINHLGKTNWVKEVGTNFTGTRVLLADNDNDGTDELYARKWTAYSYRSDEGAVYRFDRSGRVVAQFTTQNSIKSFVTSRFAGKENALYAADKEGTVYKLDSRLKVTQKTNLNHTSVPLIVDLVDVHDYDGDGKPDLLLSSYNRLQKGRNPRSDSGPKNKVLFSNMSYRVLSGDLQETIKQVSIAEEWDKWRGFKVISLDRPEMKQFPFIALSDKVTFFNY